MSGGEQAGALGGCRGDKHVALPGQQQLLGRRRRLLERVLIQRVTRYSPHTTKVSYDKSLIIPREGGKGGLWWARGLK